MGCYIKLFKTYIINSLTLSNIILWLAEVRDLVGLDCPYAGVINQLQPMCISLILILNILKSYCCWVSESLIESLL